MKNNNKFGIGIIVSMFILLAFAASASADVVNFKGNISDATGIAILNANVTVTNTTQLTEVIGTVLSDAGGLYVLSSDVLVPAQYDVYVAKDGYTNQTATAIALAAGDVVTDFSLGPQPTIKVSGTVKKSSDSGNLAGVTVTLKKNAATLATNTTDSNGYYEAYVIDVFPFDINFTMPGYYPNNTQKLAAGNLTLNMLMDIQPTTGTLNGTVKDQFNNPVENAIVYFKVSSTNSTNSSVLTNSNGYYTTNLAQKEYYIEVEKSPGYLGDSSGNIFLTNGQTNTTDFTLTDISIISGTTTPAGVNVTFKKNGADAYSLISNSATGAFTQTVEVGFYNITSTKSGYYDSNLFNANFTEDVSGYTITLSAIPAPSSSDSGSNTQLTGGSSSDYAPEITALSYSYSFASVPANKATGMVFKNIGINQITFETMQELKNADFKLEKYDEKPAGLPDAPGAAYKFIKIDTKNVPGEAIKYVRFNFEASNSWINEKGINPESVKLYRLVGGKWTELSTKKTGQTSEAVYYEANSPGFSFFAIAAGTASAPEGQQPQQPVSGTGGNIIITPDGQTGTANGTVPPITGGAVGAAFKGKQMFTYIIIGLLVVAAIFAAVYYSKKSKKKGFKRNKKGHRK